MSPRSLPTPTEIVAYFKHIALAEARVTMDFSREALDGRKRTPRKIEKEKTPRKKRRTKAEMAAAAAAATKHTHPGDPSDPGPPAAIGEGISRFS